MKRREFLVLMSSANVFALHPRFAAAETSRLAADEQVDPNLRWFLLNASHPDFDATRANLLAAWHAHSSAPAEEVPGRNAGEKVIKTYMSAAQRTSSDPTLAIGVAAVLDEFNYSASVNPHYAPRRMHTNQWGDTFPVWGAFLEPPMRLPTTAEDRRLAHARGFGSDKVLYVAQTARGSGDGSGYLNACAIKDILHWVSARARIDPTQFNLIVLCGRLSRFQNEGGAGIFWIKSGAAGSRTQLVAHPVDGGELMAGRKVGSGTGGEDPDWTPQANGLWFCETRSGALLSPGFTLADAGGTLRALTYVDTRAECLATPDSCFIPKDRIGQWNPNTRYEPGETIQYKTYTFFCVGAHTNQRPPEPKLPPNDSAYWSQIPVNVSVPTWNRATAYTVGNRVSLGGAAYICLQNHTDHRPPNPAYWAIVRPMGEWNGSAKYAEGEAVVGGGTVYVAVHPNTNKPPPNQAYWTTRDRIYVRNAQGENPRNTTYCKGGGVALSTRGTAYFDVFGVKFYQQRFLGSRHDHNDEFAFYACWLSYGGPGKTIFADGRLYNRDTGQFTMSFAGGANQFYQYQPHVPNGRKIVGCRFEFLGDGLYDVSVHDLLPTNTVVRDSYFENIGQKAALAHGLELGNSDSHSVSALGGAKGWLVRNNRFHRCGPATCVIYPVSTPILDPSLILTDGAVANGTFDTGIAGWSDKSGPGASILWHGGKLHLNGSPGAFPKAEQAITISPSFRVIRGAGAAAVGTTVKLDGAPDLSHLVTASGPAQSLVFLAAHRNSFRWFKITSFDNAAKAVTVDRPPVGVTASPWQIGRDHVLKWTSPFDSQFRVDVGTASGGKDIHDGGADSTRIVRAGQDGTCAITFKPTSTRFYIQIYPRNPGPGVYEIDDVQLLTTLANEPLFQKGIPIEKTYRAPDASTYRWYDQACQDIEISHNWFTEPIIDNFVISEGQAISLQGDGDIYGHSGQVRNVRIVHNRIEGFYSGASIRTKWKLPSPYDHTQIEIAHNTIRGAYWALRAFSTRVDQDGRIVEPSFWFHHNDVHAEPHPLNGKPGMFVVISNAENPMRHRMVIDYNTYRLEGDARWRQGSNRDASSLFAWRRMAPRGDNYDNNSVTVRGRSSR